LLDKPALDAIRRDFSAGRANEAETAATMRDIHARTGILVDPHTAVGLTVSRRFARAGVPMITLATAHPAKFPDAARAATGLEPTLPAALSDLMRRQEQFTTIGNDRAAIERYIAGHTRALAEKV
jgi:threonine synthase